MPNFPIIISFADGGGASASIFRSTDGGATFVPITVAGTDPNDLFAQAIADINGNIIAGEGSIYVSNDSGATFRVAESHPLFDWFWGDSQNPSSVFTPTGRAVLVGAHNNSPILGGPFHGAAFWADPPYSSWNVTVITPSIQLAGVAVAPDGTLAATAFPTTGTIDPIIYRSTDDALSWTGVVPQPAPGTLHQTSNMGAMLNNGSYFLAYGDNGSDITDPGAAYKSSTGDVGTWTLNNTGPFNDPSVGAGSSYQRMLDWDPVTSKWYGGGWSQNQIFSSTDGQDFSHSEIGPVAGEEYYGINMIAGKVFVLGTYGGVSPTGLVIYRLDSGSWTRIQIATPHSDTFFGGGLVGNTTRLCIGTSDGFWFYSDDLGDTWTLSASSMPGGSFASAIVAVPQAPSIVPSGDLIGFTFNEEQGVTAWHRHPMVGGVKAIACIPNPSKSQDDLWMIVQRSINGVQKQYVEFMAPHFVTGDDLATDAFYSDSGTTYNGAATQTITGLDYLEGQTVKVLTDGALHPDCVVTSGQISLQWPAKIVQVGLPQLARLTTMPMEAGATTGSAAGKVKRLTDLTMRLQNTLGGKIGREDPDAELSDPPQTAMERMEFRGPHNLMSQALPIYNGLFPNETYGQNWPGGYEVEGRITYLNDEPFPVTIVGFYPNADSED